MSSKESGGDKASDTEGTTLGKKASDEKTLDEKGVKETALPAAARRALAEAAARRAAAQAAADAAGGPDRGASKEIGGRDGPDPARYGDWEKKGIISDF